MFLHNQIEPNGKHPYDEKDVTLGPHFLVKNESSFNLRKLNIFHFYQGGKCFS